MGANKTPQYALDIICNVVSSAIDAMSVERLME